MRPGAFFALLLALPLPAPASPEGAAPAVEALLAADAAVFAPPDLKHQLVKHRARLMQGVADAAAREAAAPGAAARRDTAVRAARELIDRIRRHERFSEVAWGAGALVHACAAVDGLPGAAPPRARFLGFSSDPFGAPESLLDVPAAAERWDAAVTRATRLLAFAWKKAGGNAAIATQMPAAKGPWFVRE